MSKTKRIRGTCSFPSCPSKWVYTRGVCWYHYRLFSNLVSDGVRTWPELEEVGYVTPSNYRKNL